MRGRAAAVALGAALLAAVAARFAVEPRWTLVLDRPTPGKYEDLAFPTPTDGWVIAASGDILHTGDGGASWEVQASKMGHLRSLELLDARRGFAGTLNGRLYATVDGGVTWEDVTARLPVAPGGFCGMAHVGDRVHLVGRFVGGVTDHFVSVDAGATWVHHDLGALMQGLVEIAFIDADVGFLGGMAPAGPGAGPGAGPARILKTEDGGETWRPVFTDDGGRGFAWKVFPVDDRVVVAALQTEDGTLRVARSEDAGERWAVQVVATGKRDAPGVQAVGFLDARHGWVGGFFRGMYRTTDGGQTWSWVRSEDRAINRYVRVERALVTASARGVLRWE